MEELAVHLRYMQFCAHNYHNLVKGSLFFQDHAFLGDLYGTYEDEYDAVVERSIGLGLPMELAGVQKRAAAQLQPYATQDNKDAFKMLVTLEQELCSAVEVTIKTGGMSEGTRQFLGNICDNSEARQYKLKQRIK